MLTERHFESLGLSCMRRMRNRVMSRGVMRKRVMGQGGMEN